MIERIEAHSYLSTPADIETDYDGWLIRLSQSSAKRANSVNFPLRQVSGIPLEDKIGKCEEIFHSNQKSCIFRITPLAEPNWLGSHLQERSYSQVDPTDVLIQDISALKPTADLSSVEITNQLSPAQFKALASLTEKAADKYDAFEKLLAQIKIDCLFGFIRLDGEIVSAGMATVDDNLMGLFEFATHPDYQRRGFAAQIAQALLQRGQKVGIQTAYLQVVQSNEAAQKFWKRQNFAHHLYSYSYFVKAAPPAV